jgi:alkane 1-monooxygenase
MLNSQVRNRLYVLSLTPACIVMFGNLNGGLWTLGNVIFSLVILALIEWFTVPITANASSSADDIMPKILLYAHVPVQFACLVSLIYGIHAGILTDAWVYVAALSVGLNSGSSAIIVAHELIHRPSRSERFLGKLLLFTVCNPYFYIDHIKVHHKHVGTFQDHVTARYREHLYRFFIRSVTSQLIGAIRLENQRLQHANVIVKGIQNYVYQQISLQIVVIVLLFAMFGLWAVVAYFIQCLFANFLLEYVNYTQHYGLIRKGKQRVSAIHSWDSDQFVSRFILVDLSRHADHHAYAAKPYHTLDHMAQSPKLPSGYAGMFFIAAIPFLWFKMIHPLMDTYHKKIEANE